MSKFRYIFLLMIVLGCISCNPDKVYYEDKVVFEYGVWPRFEHLKFNIPIDNIDRRYDLVLTVNYDSDIDYDELPLQVNTEASSGEKRFSEFRLNLKEKDGTRRGGKEEDGTYSFNHIIRNNFTMSEEGVYAVDIECFYPKYNIPYINWVSVKMVKTSAEEK